MSQFLWNCESLLKLLVRRYSWMGKSQRIHDLWDEHGPLKFKQKYISTISTTKQFHLRIFPHPKKTWAKNSPKNLVYQKISTEIWIQKTQGPSNLFPRWFRWLSHGTTGGSPWYIPLRLVGLRLRYHILQRCAWKIPVDRWDCSPSTAPIIIGNLSHASQKVRPYLKRLSTIMVPKKSSPLIRPESSWGGGKLGIWGRHPGIPMILLMFFFEIRRSPVQYDKYTVHFFLQPFSSGFHTSKRGRVSAINSRNHGNVRPEKGDGGGQ